MRIAPFAHQRYAEAASRDQASSPNHSHHATVKTKTVGFNLGKLRLRYTEKDLDFHSASTRVEDHVSPSRRSFQDSMHVERQRKAMFRQERFQEEHATPSRNRGLKAYAEAASGGPFFPQPGNLLGVV